MAAAITTSNGLKRRAKPTTITATPSRVNIGAGSLSDSPETVNCNARACKRLLTLGSPGATL